MIWKAESRLVPAFCWILEGTIVLKTAMIFGNHMTLQREKEIAVWGWADFGTEITVNLSGNTACASTREDGTWQVTLPPISARTGLTMTWTNWNW